MADKGNSPEGPTDLGGGSWRDTLKRTVPVWKKEHFEDGEVWVGLQGGS